MERCDAQREAVVSRQEARQIGAGGRPQAIFGEQFGEGFAPPGRFGEQQDAAGMSVDKAFQARERVFGAALDGQRRQDGRGLCSAEFGALQDEARVRRGGDEEGFFGEEQFVRRQQRSAGLAREQAMTGLGILPETAQGLGDVAVQAEAGVRGQVVEERRRLVEEERQPVFDAGRGDAVRDVLVDARARRVALENFAEALAEARPAFVVEREFTCRQEADFVHLGQGALAIDVEGLDAFDLVVEQVDAVGLRRTHREEVDQAAADRVFAGRDDLGDMGVAGQRQLGAQGFGVESFADLEEEGVGREVGRRRETIGGGRGRHEQHLAFAARDGVERGQAFGDEVVVWRKAVVGQRFPIGQEANL